MKTDILLAWSFALIIFSAIMITLNEFIQYKLTQRVKAKIPKGSHHPTQGHYFERYVPKRLQEEFSQKLSEHQKQIHPQVGRQKYIVSGMLTLLYILGIGLFLDKQYYKLYKPIDLTAEERHNLNLTTGQWEILSELEFTPYGKRQPTSKIQKRNYVILKPNRESVNQKSLQGKYVNELFLRWKTYLDSNQRRFKVCYWNKLSRCAMNTKSDIILSLPGYWQEVQFKHLLKQGYSLLVYGAPLNLIANEYELKILDLRFSPFRNQPQAHYPLRFVGDKRLTLGIPSGQYVFAEANQTFNNYKVESGDPEAISTSMKRIIESPLLTRLSSSPVENGRLVWTDLPLPFLASKSSNGLALKRAFSNIDDFLSHRSYSAWATWPKGKQFAAVIEQDTEFRYENSQKVADIVMAKGFPITWFMVSNLSEKNKRLTRKLASLGEVACHGDNHDVFPSGSLYQQVYRLAKCKKTLHEITGADVRGFRPPEEKYNSDTYAATANTQFSYIFNDYEADSATPKILRNLKSKYELISLGRVSRDDYHLWAVKEFPPEQSKALIDEDISWIKKVGGLYTFNFHTQFMDSSERLDVLSHTIDTLKSSQAYASTAGGISQWWRLRHSLQENTKVAPELIKKYQPIQLVVDENGNLIRKNYRPR